jgi:TonB family protein
MALRKFSFVLLAITSAACMATVQPMHSRPLSDREQQVWTVPRRDSEFSSVAHTTQASCAATKPPEALATPNPLIEEAIDSSKVTVSFIIGTDGKVHSALILESAGTSEDNAVLSTIRAWRYRPATCNGVPMESEAKVGFSSR